MEQAHRIGAAADRRDERIRQSAFARSICFFVSLPMTDWKSRTIAG